MSVRIISYTRAVDDFVQPDELIAYAARVSNPDNQMNTETAPKLLRYLAKHRHWSPFEMANVCMEIKTTRDISHQIIRHRSFSFQEFSQRYAEVTEDFAIRECRMQDKTNRQNSLETYDYALQHSFNASQRMVWNIAWAGYQQALQHGIAKEQARAVLPEGLTPTTLYMNGTVRSWIHYIHERTSPATQKEHRMIAEECKKCLLQIYPSLKEMFDESE